MATLTSTTSGVPGRLLQNYPAIAQTSAGDDDDLVNEDGSAVNIQKPALKFEVSLRNNIRNINYPVHENLTIAAAIRSQSFNSDDSWSGMRLEFLPLSKYELIRGIFFNDDPNCTLFEDQRDSNRVMSFALAIAYGADFELATAGLMDHSNMLYRSHYGNLQFVHAMGSAVGEPPSETKRKIKLWLQAMYSVYSGQNGVNGDTLLNATELKEFFNQSNTTFRQLLMARTPSYKAPDIGLRALGSCMHVIEDSFAKGHCRRDDNGTGAISNFHCYDGQNHDDHSHFDSEGGSDLDPQQLSSFDKLYGGQKAITRCTEFLNAATAKLPWNDRLEGWFQATFALSANPSNSDTSV